MFLTQPIAKKTIAQKNLKSSYFFVKIVNRSADDLKWSLLRKSVSRGDKNLFECTRFTDMKVSVKIKERRK